MGAETLIWRFSPHKLDATKKILIHLSPRYPSKGGKSRRERKRENEGDGGKERGGEERARKRGRALPTETKVEGGTSQSKSGTSLNLSNGGKGDVD